MAPSHAFGQDSSHASGSADRILTGGWIWTGRPEDGPPREGWAVALKGDRIQAVGPREQVALLEGPQTAVLELENRFLMPGFVDAHVHLQAGGLDLFRVDLRGVDSPEELVRRVADRARATPKGEWILGGGWDEHLWGGELPHRGWLDRAVPEHPVLLLRTDLHVGVANSLALERAGIDGETPDPERGRIDREGAGGHGTPGLPTGILRESALDPLARRIPPPSPADREGALRAAALHALSRGVTQVHDMGAIQSPEESWASLGILRGLHASGRLPLRVLAAVPIAHRRRMQEFVEDQGWGDARLRWGLVKGFVDGSLGAGTAWFHEPYAHDPTSAGGPITDLEELRSGIFEAVEAGLQPAVHAIGDRAVDWLLSVYAEVAEGRPKADLRLRVEHAQHITPEGIRMAEASHVALSVQPAHLSDDGGWAESRIGPRRISGAFAFGTLHRAGARLALGSDWTVAPLDPRCALAAAVARRVHGTPRPGASSGPRTFGSTDERLSLSDAMRAHTLGGAWAGGMEAETGTIEVGKRGDLVVLSRNPFQLSPDAFVSELHAEMTFVDGALVWEREDPPGGGFAP
jgi:predicted amidohydrolase YtcJ